VHKRRAAARDRIQVPIDGVAERQPAIAQQVRDIIVGVVQNGTGTQAAISGVDVVGKTGTTSNYGDAWFVGWTPQLTTAVWVGYPTKLISMATAYNGQPVEGGGGRGVISVVANEIPGEFGQLTRAALAGDFVQARQLQRKYQALMEVNFVETSPGPVKFAMARMGLLEPVWRLPMVPPEVGSQKKIDAILEAVGLISRVRV